MSWRDVVLPARLAVRPKSGQGYPIPFVAIEDDGSGKPDFRILNVERQMLCFDRQLCGICGQKLDYWCSLIGGELCEVNKVFVDPAMHEECALYAIQVCPFLRRDHSRYSHRPVPDRVVSDEYGDYDRPSVMMLFRTPSRWKVFSPISPLANLSSM